MGLAAMETRFPIDELPPELLIEILSRLSWRQQLAVRRVSRRWRSLAEDSLARRQELYISSEDQDTGLNTERLLNLLLSMPKLKRLFVGDRWSNSRELLGWGVKRLGTNCTLQLQMTSLDVCTLDDAGVETLLRRLPGLRSLHLSGISAEGDCLSLLPAGLQSLSLHKAIRLTSASLRHVTRCRQLRRLELLVTEARNEELAAVVTACPQLERLAVAQCWKLTGGWLHELRHCPRLRDLDLSYTTMRSEELAAAVAACPQLERLAVARCYELTGDWLPELRGCPQLQELDISGLNRAHIYLSVVLTACGRLERLRVCGMHNPLSAFPTTSLPGLTHLDLSHTETEDDTFRRLPDLLPGLRDLRLRRCKLLTDIGLTNVLPRLTNLQALDMRYTGASSTVMLSLLSNLPLKALSYDYTGDHSVSAALQRCSSLTVLQLGEVTSELARRIAADLVKNPPPANREVTLIVEPEAVDILAPELPKNIPVQGDRPGLWGKYAGW